MTDILVVEDSRVTAKMIERSISKGGSECRLVHNGKSALEAYRSKRPDLIILDYLLPDISGLEILKIIMTEDPRALVIMITGKGFEELAAEVIKCGAKEYVVKSKNFSEPLALLVERVLREEDTRLLFEKRAGDMKRLEAQNLVSYWMAHNFNNILSSTIGYLGLIDIDDPNQSGVQQKKYLQEAGASLDRAAWLMKRLMSLTDATPKPRTEIILSELVDECFKRVEEQLGRRCAAFINNMGVASPIWMNYEDFIIVLEGVLQNALEAVGEDGKITVTGKIDEDSCIIRILDNGKGMDAETINRAAEPLFSTKASVGVGLGLSLAQAALNRSNGEMRIISHLGVGTRVTIEWPIHAKGHEFA